MERVYPAGIYRLKVNNIEKLEQGVKHVQKSTIKTPERCQWRRSGIFIVNFEHISHFVLMFLSLTLNK